MGNIQLAVEGQDAIEATKSLMAIPELSGEWQPVGRQNRAVTLATIATIVGIVGGTLKVADQIHKWYKHGKKGMYETMPKGRDKRKKKRDQNKRHRHLH